MSEPEKRAYQGLEMQIDRRVYTTMESIVRRIVKEEIAGHDSTFADATFDALSAKHNSVMDAIAKHAVQLHEAKHHVTSYGVAHFSTTTVPPLDEIEGETMTPEESD